jgi:hypothetical protein
VVVTDAVALDRGVVAPMSPTTRLTGATSISASRSSVAHAYWTTPRWSTTKTARWTSRSPRAVSVVTSYAVAAARSLSLNSGTRRLYRSANASWL